jgi:hypothetical protein
VETEEAETAAAEAADVAMEAEVEAADAETTERWRHRDPSKEHRSCCLWLLLLLVGPNGDGFGGQAFMEHYSAIFSERFGAVSKTMCKRNRWRRQLGSFGRTRVEAQSRVQSGLRVMGYSCSTVRSMSPKTEN